MGIGDWGLGIGEWGLGPNPQSPIPNPHWKYNIKLKKNIYKYKKINKKNKFIIKF